MNDVLLYGRCRKTPAPLTAAVHECADHHAYSWSSVGPLGPDQTMLSSRWSSVLRAITASSRLKTVWLAESSSASKSQRNVLTVNVISAMSWWLGIVLGGGAAARKAWASMARVVQRCQEVQRRWTRQGD